MQSSQTPETSRAELNQQLERVIDKLSDEFTPALPHQLVEERTRRQIDAFQGARITTFLPTLVYRYAREELRTLAS